VEVDEKSLQFTHKENFLAATQNKEKKSSNGDKSTKKKEN